MSNEEAKSEDVKDVKFKEEKIEEVKLKTVNEQKLSEFPKGHVLFRQGARGGDLYFITEGEVELTVLDETTGKEMPVAKAGPLSILGTMTFLEGDPRSATAKCLTVVKCIVVTQIQRKKLLAQVPVWFKALLKDMAANLRRTNSDFARVSTQNEILTKRLEIMQKRLEEGDKDKQKDKPQEEKKQPDAA